VQFIDSLESEEFDYFNEWRWSGSEGHRLSALGDLSSMCFQCSTIEKYKNQSLPTNCTFGSVNTAEYISRSRTKWSGGRMRCSPAETDEYDIRIVHNKSGSIINASMEYNSSGGASLIHICSMKLFRIWLKFTAKLLYLFDVKQKLVRRSRGHL
jgi:hypothetical protein